MFCEFNASLIHFWIHILNAAFSSKWQKNVIKWKRVMLMLAVILKTRLSILAFVALGIDQPIHSFQRVLHFSLSIEHYIDLFETLQSVSQFWMNWKENQKTMFDETRTNKIPRINRGKQEHQWKRRKIGLNTTLKTLDSVCWPEPRVETSTTWKCDWTYQRFGSLKV